MSKSGTTNPRCSNQSHMFQIQPSQAFPSLPMFQTSKMISSLPNIQISTPKSPPAETLLGLPTECPGCSSRAFPKVGQVGKGLKSELHALQPTSDGLQELHSLSNTVVLDMPSLSMLGERKGVRGKTPWWRMEFRLPLWGKTGDARPLAPHHARSTLRLPLVRTAVALGEKASRSPSICSPTLSGRT